MAKHLTTLDIEKIVKIIDGWTGKLTWSLLCEASKQVLGAVPARQTLLRSVRIKGAFDARKKSLRETTEPTGPVSVTLRAAAARLLRLEAENERLKRENGELLQQFVVWQYNAYIRGLNAKELNAALPAVDRGRTEVDNLKA